METQNKYQNAKIYRIVDIGYNKCYIGSTVERLCQRMAKHRNNFLKKRYPIYSGLLFEEFGIDNCKIELLETFPCNSREELNTREGHHIRNSECVNKQIAGRDVKEWRLEHKEQKRIYDKEYNEEKKETISARNEIYRNSHKQIISEKAKEKISCECGCEVVKSTLSRHMQSAKHKQIMAAQANVQIRA